MIFEEMLRDERAEGKAEGKAEGRAEGKVEAKIEDILELLGDKAQISEDLRSKIESEKNLETLTRWYKLAVKVDSLEEFLNQM